MCCAAARGGVGDITVRSSEMSSTFTFSYHTLSYQNIHVPVKHSTPTYRFTADHIFLLSRTRAWRDSRVPFISPSSLVEKACVSAGRM